MDKYDLYQRIKNRTEALVGKLMANEILGEAIDTSKS